jgi:hypothetical protein
VTSSGARDGGPQLSLREVGLSYRTRRHVEFNVTDMRPRLRRNTRDVVVAGRCPPHGRFP